MSGDNDTEEKVVISEKYPDPPITIEIHLPPQAKNQHVQLLLNILDVFSRTPADIIGVSRELVEHSLGLNQYATLIRKKRRSLSLEKS